MTTPPPPPDYITLADRLASAASAFLTSQNVQYTSVVIELNFQIPGIVHPASMTVRL